MAIDDRMNEMGDEMLNDMQRKLVREIVAISYEQTCFEQGMINVSEDLTEDIMQEQVKQLANEEMNSQALAKHTCDSMDLVVDRMVQELVTMVYRDESELVDLSE